MGEAAVLVSGNRTCGRTELILAVPLCVSVAVYFNYENNDEIIGFMPDDTDVGERIPSLLSPSSRGSSRSAVSKATVTLVLARSNLKSCTCFSLCEDAEGEQASEKTDFDRTLEFMKLVQAITLTAERHR